jgi:isohexenylglutaconyl-CoA hydratase
MTHYDNLETLKIVEDAPARTIHVMLNRPETKNAMNFRMVEELYDIFSGLKGNRSFRTIILSGAGGTFCAGGDVKEMRATDNTFHNERVNLDKMLRACNTADQIVVAKVEGAALGGGFGLVCVSDIAIAAESAVFGLPEVRLGVTPAFISPFVIERIGFTRARELMLSGRRFKGADALLYGLVHQCVPDAALDDAISTLLGDLKHAAPGAVAATKGLMFEVKDKPLDDTVAYRAELLNRLRGGDEAQEGLLAFMEKRPARWAMEADQ